MDLADAMLFVVDATVGPTATDEKVVKLLRKTKKPVVLVANKVDGPQGELEAAALWNLGLGEPYPVSALHGRGVGDLLDVAVAALPTETQHGGRRGLAPARRAGGPPQRRQVLAAQSRSRIPSAWWSTSWPGTTRDPVDELIEVDGELFTFIDTAGIRRRVHLSKGADYYASLRTSAAIQRAELALVLLDGSVPLTEQDLRILSEVVDAGRAIVMVVNKWDLVGEEERFMFERSFEKDLTHLTWAARVNLSALTGWHTNRLKRAMDEALTNWDRRISTGKLNTFLGELVAAHPHPVRGGKQPKILFATQASTRPPTFVLFTSGFLDPQYRRYIERRLRETFDFAGTPIHISVRVREKRGRR